MPSPNVTNFHCPPSSVANFHGSAMSVVMIRCRRSYYKEQWMVVVADEDLVNHGRTTSRNDQSMSSLLLIADDRSRWAVIAAVACVGVPHQRRLGVMGIS